jgi:hypothetical protein
MRNIIPSKSSVRFWKDILTYFGYEPVRRNGGLNKGR